MDENRTHGADSAISDEIVENPARSLIGPFEMRQDGHKVILSFENDQYAEIFTSRHRCVPINALQPGWTAYRYVTERFTSDVIALLERLLLEEGAAVTFTGPNPDSNGLPDEAVTVCNDDTGWQDYIFRRNTLADALQAAIDYQGDDPEGARRLIREMADHLDGATGASERRGSDSWALWDRAQRFLGEQA